MKKMIIFFAAAIAATTVSAQTVTESKTTDNWYIGVNGGLGSETTHTAIFKNLNPTAGIRIGRYFTPVFGLALDSKLYFDNATERNTGTIVRSMDALLMGTINFSNWLGGYKGAPRSFEVIGLAGLGIGHIFSNNLEYEANMLNSNGLVTRMGLDFAYNFSENKAWQAYLEPSITYGLDAAGNGTYGYGNRNINYNINKSNIALSAGLIYKFGNSNGSHNFTIVIPRDQAEIDVLNSKINELRGNVDAKDQVIASKDNTINGLQNQLASKSSSNVVDSTSCLGQPSVIFRQGKSVIDPAQYANVATIAKYMDTNKDAKILIQGYASPEGSAELNQTLSEKRAAVVKDALVNKYHIDANRISTKGMGETNQLFKDNNLNRAAIFSE
jgi:outer membrane protein OmpA-like peptidoglycan-associated protein